MFQGVTPFLNWLLFLTMKSLCVLVSNNDALMYCYFKSSLDSLCYVEACRELPGPIFASWLFSTLWYLLICVIASGVDRSYAPMAGGPKH